MSRTLLERGRAARKVAPYRELVPLAEAAAVAYQVITDKPVPLRDPQQLAEMRGLVAIALSSVGRVLKQEDGAAVPLTLAEISQRLFVRGAQSNLDGLCMSRAELLRAIEVLKEAHIAFDQGALLESLRKLS
jgi:hypothetical protein